MPASRIMMPAPRIKFSALRRILLDLGFKQVPVDLGYKPVRVTKPHIGFRHEEADLLLAFPPYRGNSVVAPHHLLYVRIMLDGKGILDQDDFDRLVAEVPARHPAAS